VESIVARTVYPHYEIVVADNDSREPETRAYYETMPGRVVPYPGPFNYSAINNFAVKQTDAPWILLLNNDIEVINPDWLTSMAEHIQRPEVGAVGAKLLYPDGTVQHAGVVLSPRGTALHAYAQAPANSWENGGYLQLIRNYSAVTAACMLTKRDLFDRVGGLDEIQFAVTYNDVDYCLKLREAGYQIVYTPFAQLHHYESASRGRGKGNPAEGRALRARWPEATTADPLASDPLERYQEFLKPGA
jgi:GT2 family glycosyltransferase